MKTTAAVFICLAATPGLASPARFALVVAENQPASAELAPLRYADDDALRYAELLRAAGTDVTVLTVLDDETQRKNPGAAANTRPATRAELVSAMRAVDLRIDSAKAAGQTTDFYFVFAGHGEAGPNNEGRMHLRDGTLSRAELLETVVAASRADFNHLLVDACHAQSLVFQRGAPDDGYRADDYKAEISEYLSRQDLRAYPNTGAVLAASAGRETHEWEVFGGGVFSHEVRSGLAGIADVNGDGAVEYSELAAYVQAANQMIPDLEARPQLLFHAPARDRNRPLFVYTDGPERFLRLPPGYTGRGFLEDARGIRYADFNPSGEQPVIVALAASPFYYLRGAGGEARFAATERGVVDAGELDFSPREAAARGALDDAFRRHLFGVPFGPGFYAGYVSSAAQVPAIHHDTPALPSGELNADADLGAGGGGTRFGVAKWVAAGTAVAAAGAAVALGLSARDDYDRFRSGLDTRGEDDRALRDDIDTKVLWTNVAGGAAILATGAALTLFLLDEPESSGVVAGPTLGGAYVGGRF